MKRSFVLGFGLAVTCSAEAAIPLLWCDNCADAQKEDMAKTQPPNTTVYVGDVVKKTVYAYNIYMDVDDGVRPPRRYKAVDRFTPPADYAAAAMSYVNFYNAAPKGWQKSQQVHYDGPGSGDRIAYDVVNTSPMQNDMLDWAADNTSFVTVVVDSLSLFMTGASPKEQYEIIFWDGSKITIERDVKNMLIKYEVVQDSGRDSHNNTILSKARDNPVQFNFVGPGNPKDPARWSGQMTMLGYSGMSAHGGVWACTKSAAGLHCSYVQY